MAAGLFVVAKAKGKPTTGVPGGSTQPPGFPFSDDPTQPPHTDDRVFRFARAVSIAEGYQSRSGTYLTSNKAFRYKNPGDIFGNVNGKYVLRTYPTHRDGWLALYRLLDPIFASRSTYYSLAMPISEIARIYVVGPNGDPNSQPYMNWARIVAGELGVSTNTTLEEWYKA